jgi:type IV secretory pathway TraG/TraD family ATPase VirD4
MSDNDKPIINVEPTPKSISQKHRELYTPEEVKKVKIVERTTVNPVGVTKIKYTESKTYANGVIKNRLIGVRKEGKMLWGRDK